MVAWWWLVVAVFISFYAGYAICAWMSVAKEQERERAKASDNERRHG